MRRFRGDFRHYIRDQARALGQAQTEVCEELGGGGFGRGDDAQAQTLIDAARDGVPFCAECERARRAARAAAAAS